MMPLLTIFSLGEAVPGCAKDSILGLVPWYVYLTPTRNSYTGRCDFKEFSNTDPGSLFGLHSPLFLIGLAVLNDLIRVAALVSVGYVIYGGIQYAVSQGSPDATHKAQQTIINALIGLVLSILAAAIVGFIGNSLGGS